VSLEVDWAPAEAQCLSKDKPHKAEGRQMQCRMVPIFALAICLTETAFLLNAVQISG
jgi:hypothetical protein